MDLKLSFFLVSAISKHRRDTGEDLMPLFHELLREHREMRGSLEKINEIVSNRGFFSKPAFDEISKVASIVESIKKQ